MAMSVCGDTPILHDDLQNLKGVLDYKILQINFSVAKK